MWRQVKSHLMKLWNRKKSENAFKLNKMMKTFKWMTTGHYELFNGGFQAGQWKLLFLLKSKLVFCREKHPMSSIIWTEIIHVLPFRANAVQVLYCPETLCFLIWNLFNFSLLILKIYYANLCEITIFKGSHIKLTPGLYKCMLLM